MEHNRRHQRFWTFLKPLVTLILRLKFSYTGKPVEAEGPYIVLSNHVTDWDPLMVGVSFKKQMYFVASEHILRWGFLSRLIEHFISPIARQKGGSAASTVKNILRTVKAGYNVAIFPEGNRCWDGVTRDFPSSTAKLVRSSGCTLITYRITGGYFASPRWAGSKTRRGRMTGEAVGIYSPEELRSMKAEEICEIIARDLHEDAYARQRENPVSFKGRRLAESLETLLFTCPVCGAMHTLSSSRDLFRCCACGMETRYTPTGFFEGGGLPFDDVYSWSRWQDEHLAQLVKDSGEEPIFTDEGIELLDVETGRGSTSLGKGELKLFADRLELPGGMTVRLEEIAGMSMQSAMKLYLTTAEGRHLMLLPSGCRCTGKYLTACELLGAAVGYGV